MPDIKNILKTKIGKGHLLILAVLVLSAAAFLVIQLTQASPAAPNPGHSWSQIGDFPANCPSGQYISGVGSSLICSVPSGGVGGSTMRFDRVSNNCLGAYPSLCPSGWTQAFFGLTLDEAQQYNCTRNCYRTDIECQVMPLQYTTSYANCYSGVDGPSCPSGWVEADRSPINGGFNCVRTCYRCNP